MLSFKEYIIENSGANKHLEHIEDELLNSGYTGLRNAIEYMIGISKSFIGVNKGITVTTKWDGAPAIIAGKDPETGNFFVTTKHGATAKSMKLNFTDDDIDKNHPGEGLNKKLKTCLRELKKINLKGVYQGDLLYSEKQDKKIETIDGQKYLTFTPNTITYAIPLGTELYKKIQNSKLGIVWHTKYTGNGPVNQMNATFDLGENFYQENNSVWSRTAKFEYAGGIVSFDENEQEKYKRILSALGKIFRKIDKNVIDTISKNSEINIEIKTFFNTKVREGKSIQNSDKHVMGLIQYLKDKLNNKVKKLKTEKGRLQKQEKNEEFLKFFRDNKAQLSIIFDTQKLIIAAKNILIKKMQSIESIEKTFVKTSNGYKITNPEGFVAYHIDKGALKLVDRLEFSKQNFTINKNW
jgi:hypothetical protein